MGLSFYLRSSVKAIRMTQAKKVSDPFGSIQRGDTGPEDKTTHRAC
jgi:hypothetical protein